MTQTAMPAPNTAPTPSALSQMRGSEGTTVRIATNPPKAPAKIPKRIARKARLMPPTTMPRPLSLDIGISLPLARIGKSSLVEDWNETQQLPAGAGAQTPGFGRSYQACLDRRIQGVPTSAAYPPEKRPPISPARTQ